jgi:HEAT repeat protein
MDKLTFTMLKDASYAIRMEAAQSLIKLGPPHAPETDPEAYLKAARPYNEGVTSRLKAEKDDRVKIWLLVLTLMYDDKQAEPAVSKIAAYLKVENPPVQINALQALSLLGTNAKPVLTPIRETLRVHDQLVSAAAVTCLMALGATAKPAIPDLEQLQSAAKDEELKKAYGRAITVIRSAVDAPPQPPKKDPPKKDPPKK